MTISIPNYKLTPPKPVPPKPSGTKYKEGNLNARHGWLSPKGVLYPCKYADHDWMAEYEHLDPGEYAGEGSPFKDTATEQLEKKGWIKLQKKIFHPGDHVGIDDEWYVTQRQFKFINDCLAHHGVDCMGGMNLRIRGK